MTSSCSSPSSRSAGADSASSADVGGGSLAGAAGDSDAAASYGGGVVGGDSGAAGDSAAGVGDSDAGGSDAGVSDSDAGDSGAASDVVVANVRVRGCGKVDRVAVGFDLEPVEGKRFFLTVAHTLRGAKEVLVDGLPARVVALDHRPDLAVLAVAGRVPTGWLRGASPVAGGSAGSGGSASSSAAGSGVARDAEDVATAGLLRPVDRAVDVVRVEQSSAPAVISRVGPINMQEPRDNTTYRRDGFVFTVPGGRIQSGDSGSPVVDADGRLVGVLFATSKDNSFTGFATAWSEVRRLVAGGVDGTANTNAGPCDE